MHEEVQREDGTQCMCEVQRETQVLCCLLREGGTVNGQEPNRSTNTLASVRRRHMPVKQQSTTREQRTVRVREGRRGIREHTERSNVLDQSSVRAAVTCPKCRHTRHSSCHRRKAAGLAGPQADANTAPN